jgi:hypothetical protein
MRQVTLRYRAREKQAVVIRPTEPSRKWLIFAGRDVPGRCAKLPRKFLGLFREHDMGKIIVDYAFLVLHVRVEDTAENLCVFQVHSANNSQRWGETAHVFGDPGLIQY